MCRVEGGCLTGAAGRSPLSALDEFAAEGLPSSDDRLRVGCLNGRGATKAEDAQGTPTQSDISPIILVYEETSVTHPCHGTKMPLPRTLQ